jgi:fatty-acyl-CoA synthase
MAKDTFTVAQVLSDRSQHDSSRPAVAFGDELWTYGELIDRVTVAAQGLQRLGIKKGDRIAVWLPNTPEWIIMELAIGLIGAIQVALNPRYKLHEISYILKNSESRALCFFPSFEKYDYLALLHELLPDLKAHSGAVGQFVGFPDLQYVISMAEPAAGTVMYKDWFNEIAPCDPEQFINMSAEDDVYNILYTSGTTSFPKGAMLTYRNVLKHSFNAGRALGMSREDRVFGALPYCGVWGLNTFFAGLVNGALSVPLARFTGQGAAELLERHRCTVFNGTDLMYQRLIEQLEIQPRDLSGLRTGTVVFFGSNSADELPKIESFIPSIKIVQPYGMTEIGSMVFMGDPQAPREERLRSGGRLVSPEIGVRVADLSSGEEMPAGTKGELQFKGYNVMKGYFKNEEETAKTFTADGWFKTGDLGTVDNGNVLYVGRIKEAMRLRGFLVSPKEIENYLVQHQDIEEAQVVGVIENGQEVAAAFVRLKKGAVFSEAKLVAFCQAQLADFKRPKYFFPVDDFPRTAGSNGEKVQKNKLKEMAEKYINS